LEGGVGEKSLGPPAHDASTAHRTCISSQNVLSQMPAWWKEKEFSRERVRPCQTPSVWTMLCSLDPSNPLPALQPRTLTQATELYARSLLAPLPSAFVSTLGQLDSPSQRLIRAVSASAGMAASIRSWIKDRLTRFEAKNKTSLEYQPGADVQVERVRSSFRSRRTGGSPLPPPPLVVARRDLRADPLRAGGRSGSPTKAPSGLE
jgi:hypothetical protein